MTESLHQQPEPDDERMAELLRSLNGDAPPPDRRFLDRLRELSTEEFSQHAAGGSIIVPQTISKAAPIVVWNGRYVMATLAVLLVFVGYFFSPFTGTEAPLAFGEVLTKFSAADTLHLQVIRDGKTDEVWIRQPGQLRRQESATKYRIVQGSRLWRIDERENLAADEESPYFRGATSPIEVLSLIDAVKLDKESPFWRKQPTGRTRREGRDYYVYQVDVLAGQETMRIEALVDARDQQLRLLETKARRGGQFVPVGELRVLAVNAPIDDDKFLVGKHLTADGRIGKIVDSQGLVTVKPVMNRRWTPVGGAMLVKPGDWLRTDVRGANAATVRLENGTAITLGPGSLVEFIRPNELRLVNGEAKIAIESGELKLLGPGKQALTLKKTVHYRIDQEQFVVVKTVPPWLAGYEGASVGESLGSLIAKVDGRNVPLTVGYHKVNVEIRDQIARTTIEESFVNHTGGRLEGVFHFPLPPDASISGFGMWIGGELVEADVVEKQRAREIYETILREKRDPGLLEWAGGNIFKARVFPIFAHSEKRIKITYTQVLPLRGNRYRYSYGLQSEMLKQTPLRELAIDVKVHSAMPLKGITCPTHTVRTDLTANSAHVEFTAQEYTPTRDFEAVIEVAERQGDVVIVPHRRGDDGYFLMQLMPPAAEGAWRRDVLPNGEPLELLLVADTSASMKGSQRTKQDEFIAALLASLSPDDRFNLVACDAARQWLFEKPVQATDKNVAAVRKFLAERVSLGWSDLDLAFKEVIQRTTKKTQVIYVGDGIVTTTSADPDAFVKRLGRMYGNKGTFHAVAMGSSYEAVVLKAIASLGGGSWRSISGERGPRVTATELLKEISRPMLRDIQVEFRGLQVARVYPQELPNVPAGRQQIVLGRYLPEGRDQVGEVIVSGKLGGETVRYRSQISLADAERGNSFIPRLWARRDLDYLLSQGGSQAIQDEIVGLSEEFHIMTPYTSLLVLESDADRERFKVKRRFRMRDGERFFAKGRKEANYELKQQQMQRAGNWRLQLRQSVLRELSGMGRQAVTQPRRRKRSLRRPGDSLEMAEADSSRGFGGGGIGGGSNNWYFGNGSIEELFHDSNGGGIIRSTNGTLQTDRFMLGAGNRSYSGQRWDLGYTSDVLQESAEGLPAAFYLRDDLQYMPFNVPPPGRPSDLDDYPKYGSLLRNRDRYSDSKSFDYIGPFSSDLADPRPISRSRWGRGRGERLGVQIFDVGDLDSTVQLFNEIMPRVPGVPQESAEKPQAGWSAEAVALVESLLRTEQLTALKTGLEINRTSDSFDSRWKTQTARSERLELVSPTAWLVSDQRVGSQTLVHWCDEKQRGILSRTFLLGKTRNAKPADLKRPPLDLRDHSLQPLHRTYRQHIATMEPAGEGRVLLTLTHREDKGNKTTFLIDTGRDVLLTITEFRNGKVSRTLEFSEFVEIADDWWAGQIETKNATGERIQLVRQKVKSLENEAFGKRLGEELAIRERSLLLPQELPSYVAARKAIAGGTATFSDQITLMYRYAATQQWNRVHEHLRAAEPLAEGKTGFRWIEDQILHHSRRHEELRLRIMAEVDRLVATPRGEELFLANFLFNQASRFSQQIERLEVHEKLRLVYERQPAIAHGLKQWLQRRASLLNQAGRQSQAFEIYKQLAAEYRHDVPAQLQFVQALVSRGDYTAAYAWLEKVLAAEPLWSEYERERIHGRHADMLRNQSRYPELIEYLTRWVAENSSRPTAYEQYLSALIWDNRIDEAEGVIQKWFGELTSDQPIEPATLARLNAAVRLTTGRGYQLRNNRILEQWIEPLATTVRTLVKRGEQLNLAKQIMGNSEFQRTEACRAIRQEIAVRLQADAGKMLPAHVRMFTDWILTNDPVIDHAVWKEIVRQLQERWLAEGNAAVKSQLGGILLRIYSQRFSTEEQLAFLRLQLEQGPQRHRAQYANYLWNALLQRSWTAEFENEAFTVLPKLGFGAKPDGRLAVQTSALLQLTDRMVQSRFDAAWRGVEHPEKLTRTEQREKRATLMKEARTGFAERLKLEAAKHEPPLRDWLVIERIYLDVQLERDLEQVAEQCWTFLGETPPQPPEADEVDQMWLHNATLRQRYLLTAMNLAARKTPQAGLVERVLKYLDAGIAVGGDSGIFWRGAKYQMLVALDRAEELGKSLRTWIRTDEDPAMWRLVLGRLLAEQGKIAEAVGLFETVEREAELGPADYTLLADWYMVLDRRGDYERVMVDVFTVTGEDQLRNWLSRRRQQWQSRRDGTPGQLDERVLFAFRALLRKSNMPQNNLSHLQQFYKVSQDFRLLEGLPETVIGHTAAGVYPYLSGMRSVLTEVRDEATADEILARLIKVRDRAKTPVDRRALDLLEALVERRGAELHNQPGPHTAAALAAMRRAFEHEWAPGERELMADYLRGLGRIAPRELADEQVRQLAQLYRGESPGSFARLKIAHRLAMTVWRYQEHDAALEWLEVALREYETKSKNGWVQAMRDPLSTYLQYLEARGRYADGERTIQIRLKDPVFSSLHDWLSQRLNELYVNALRSNGAVSFGSGATLYKNVQAKLRREIEAERGNRRNTLIRLLCDLYRTAHEKEFGASRGDIRGFAFGVLPEILKHEQSGYNQIINQTSEALRIVRGERDALEFLILRLENPPGRFRYTRYDGWSQYASKLGEWRQRATGLGNLEPRLLEIVKRELRRDLETQSSRNGSLYHRNHSSFWRGQANAFAAVAEEVLAKHNDSAATMLYVSEYFWQGLRRYDRAIAIKFTVYERGMMNDSALSNLGVLLHERGRYGESIPVYRELAKHLPSAMEFRSRLMQAYHQTQRQADALALLKETDAYFHSNKLWHETNVVILARGCRESGLNEQAAAYFEEAISLHQDARANRGVGNGTLSTYYAELAVVYSSLGQTDKAVDAACGAIVSWGSRHQNRQQAIDALNQVLSGARDRDAYVARLDQEFEKTGQDRPIVRKALGQVYFNAGQFPLAKTQLELAVELQPNDMETQRLLLRCYENLGDREQIVGQLLRMIALQPREIGLYRQLGDREGEAGRKERAYTSIVEALANESESHAMLADIRQKQDRWPAAVEHWRQVARIRQLEPTGLLGLAKAQIHLQRWPTARKTLEKLRTTKWPPRFENVGRETRKLEEQVRQLGG